MKQPTSRSGALDSISFWLTASILWLAPFELLTPVLSFPGQRITNLELVIGAALLASGCFAIFARGGRIWKTPLTFPLLLLLLVILASAGLAAETRTAVLFTGRFAIAVLILHLVSQRVDSRRRFFHVLVGITLAGCAVALLGVLEFFQVPPVLELLRAFQAEPNYAGSQIRVGSTLQYPTITSMYLEMVLALNMGLLLYCLEQRRRMLAGLLWVAELLLAGCLYLTLTRSGILTLVLTFLLAAAYALRHWGWDIRSSAIGLLGLALVLELIGSSLLSQESLLRLTTVDSRNWYQVHYRVPERLELRSGVPDSLEIEIENTGQVTWPSAGEHAVQISYHWLVEDGSKVVDYEGVRTPLPHPVQPGETVRVRVTVWAPGRPGTYRLAWDLLVEGLFWFSSESAPSAWTRVTVSGQPAAPSPLVLQKPPLSRFLLSRSQLWSLAFAMWRENPWLGVGPDNFRLLYGPFAAMEIYDLTYHTHNLFLEFFVDTGLIGGVLFLWVVFRLLRLLISGSIAADPIDLPLWTGVSAAVLAILVHGLLDFFLEFTPTYAMIFGVFGLVTTLHRGFRRAGK